MTAEKTDKPNGSFFDQVERKLAEDRVIHLTGDVCEVMAHELEVRLHYLASLSDKPITIYLNTPGGNILQGIAIYDTIREVERKCQVNIVATGCCMSMGVVILQAATKRLALPHTQFLLHELSTIAHGSMGQLQDMQKYQVYLQSLMDSILAERTGASPEKLRKLYHRKDYYITAQDAKKLKLVDGIVSTHRGV